MTSSCRSPLVHTRLPPSRPRTPEVSVQRPPASSTMTVSAAMSHGDSSGSADTSTDPPATIMCDQQSPYARVRQQERPRSRKFSRRPFSSQPPKLEYEKDASSSLETDETRIRDALVRLLPVHAPPSAAAHQRRPSAGADTRPTTTLPYSMSAISVAQTGTPRT